MDFSRLTPEQQRRLVGGRRKYNAQQQRRRETKLAELAELIDASPLPLNRMSRTKLASDLGVSRMTLYRYLAILKKHRCPFCGRLLNEEQQHDD